jgi:hypothetical protein
MTGLIDVHTHMIPTGYPTVARPRDARARWPRLPEWRPDLALKRMVAGGEKPDQLSTTPPGGSGADAFLASAQTMANIRWPRAQGRSDLSRAPS